MMRARVRGNEKDSPHSLCAIALNSCGYGWDGSESDYPDDVPTQSPPIVSRVEPTSGPAGTVITIYGFGFSLNPAINVVIVGDAGASATDYQLVASPTANEIEQLTATVPADAAIGESGVVVVVYENASNADVLFDVTP